MAEALWTRFREGRGIWLSVPAFVFLTIFFIAPMAVLLSFGFTEIERGQVREGTFTLKYLTNTLTDDLFWWVWWKSFYIGVLSTLLCFLLAYPLAYVYSNSGRVMRLLILILTISPLLTSAIVRTYAWLVILGGRRGVVNVTLIELGLIDRPIRMLNTDFAVIMGMTQVHLPFMILPLITVLAARDRNMEAASLGMGASRIATFFKITVPMSTPGIVAGLTIVFALSYTNFIIPQLLGGGGFTTLAVQVYEQIVVILDWGRGAMLALLLLGSCFVFILAIGLAGNRAMRWAEREAAT
ncbi:MAG: ABC transporter permease [Pseudomonadota bacterium]